MVKGLKANHADPDLMADVEVSAKAGRFLLEFPDQFSTQNGINHSIVVLDTGIESARQLQKGQSPWKSGREQTHAYYSSIDGSVQSYGITLPASYDPRKPQGSTCGCTDVKIKRRNRNSCLRSPTRARAGLRWPTTVRYSSMFSGGGRLKTSVDLNHTPAVPQSFGDDWVIA